MSGGWAHELYADLQLPAVLGAMSGQPGVQAESTCAYWPALYTTNF